MNRMTKAGLILLASVLTAHVSAARLSPCQGQFGPGREAAYRFELSTEGFTLEEESRQGLALASRALYDSWADLLSATPPFAVDVQLRLVGQPADFEKLQQEIAPELYSVSGFYSPKLNLAVVLYPGGDEMKAHRSAIHEVSHLLTITQVGAAPRWLAEGLAEYYETISVTEDGSAKITANDRHLEYLASGELPALPGYFSIPEEKWRQAGGKDYYSLAWSLVFFMMETAEGRGALGLVLQQGSTHSCLPWSASAFLHQAWPGGLVEFERQWREWLALGVFRDQHL